MALIDEVTIHVEAGTGGNGCISFRREKYVPRGGPNGGNGGRGGHVTLVATRDKASLLDFKYQPKYVAGRGEHGMGSDCDGHAGEDLTLLLPVGTLVFDADTGELLTDLKEHGEQFVLAEGGRGGRGNRTFKSSTNRAPRMSTPGVAGQIVDVRLELRLIADVGLLGLPNAGKSSFLKSVTRATPKVADYPFTTLEPHLGVVDRKDRAFVVADLPGLVEGASDGVGLGFQFLKHVSRNRILLHLVDVSAPIEEIEKNIETIRNEVKSYDLSLLDREEILVFSKVDLIAPEEWPAKQKQLEALGGRFFISSHTRVGVNELLDYISETLSRAAREEEEARIAAIPPEPAFDAPYNDANPLETPVNH